MYFFLQVIVVMKFVYFLLSHVGIKLVIWDSLFLSVKITAFFISHVNYLWSLFCDHPRQGVTNFVDLTKERILNIFSIIYFDFTYFISALILTIYFLMFIVVVLCSSVSNFLRWKLIMLVFKAIGVPLSSTSLASHKL